METVQVSTGFEQATIKRNIVKHRASNSRSNSKTTRVFFCCVVLTVTWKA